jgi:hypothetical protein
MWVEIFDEETKTLFTAVAAVKLDNGERSDSPALLAYDQSGSLGMITSVHRYSW